MQRAGVVVAAAVALMLAIGALFLVRFRPAWQLLSVTGRAAAAAAVVILAAIGCGVVAIHIMRRRDDAISLADALLIGFVVLGTLLGIVAWIGVALEASVATITILLSLYGAIAVWRRRTSIAAPRFSILLAIPLLFAAIEAIVPVNSPDELVYKLATAHTYQMYGRMLELPLNSHSYLAMALQLGDLAALILGGGIAAKLVHFGLYVAGLLVIRRLALQFTEHADLIAAVVAWTPALMIVSGFAWSEWPLVALLVLSYERFIAADHEESFAALGAAVACKYTALPWLFAMFVVIAWRERRLLARAAVIVAVFGAFFYVRNAIWTGSPVAPLLLRDAPPLSHFRGESAWWDLTHGVAIFDAELSDESLGIAFPALALAGIAALVSRRRELRDLALLGVIQLPLLVAMAPVPRNLIAAALPLAIAGTAIVAGNAIVAVVVRLAFAVQAVLVLFVFSSFDVLPYLGGTETQQQYIARERDFAKPFDFIRQTTPRRSRILLLGDNRTFYLDRESVAASNSDGPRLAAWLSRFTTPDALVAEWRRMGITHVAMHKRWYRVAGGRPLQPIEREYMLEVSPQTDQVVTSTLKTRALLRYRDDEYLVFELKR